MFSVVPSELSIPVLHQYLLGAVGPRPICFASTIDSLGNRNLAPFSFFNVFSANPPILVFSPAHSGRTAEPKHTYLNCKEVPEVVINIVNFNMVQQMSLASSPYPKEVDEFVKSGFTPIKSDLVKPFRVKESPVQMECKVNQIIELGNGGGSGNLIICEVLKIHIDKNILTSENKIDQTKIDLVSRMGADWYCRADVNSMFELKKPLTTCGIGVDVLPDYIKNNPNLSANDIGKLGNLESLPSAEFIANTKQNFSNNMEVIKNLLDQNKVEEAFSLLVN